jgi:hypothetical protein
MFNMLAISAGCFALLSFAFWVGGETERMKQELADAHTQSRCYAKGKFEAFVAKDGTDFVCFKQNIETKKISRSSIVMGE